MKANNFLDWLAFFAQKGMPQVYALALYAQANFETGRMSSNIFNVAKNLFGMRPSSRKTMYDGVMHTSNGDFAKYDSYERSILDRVALDAQNGLSPVDNINDLQEYMRTVLDNGYIGNENKEAYFDTWFTYVREFLNVYREQIHSVPNAELDYWLAQGDANTELKGSIWTKWWFYLLLGLPIGFFALKYLKKKMEN